MAKATESHPEDEEYIRRNIEIVQQLVLARRASKPSEVVRNTVIKNLSFVYSPENELESIRAFVEHLLEDISGFSFDITTFAAWKKDRKVITVRKKEEPPPEACLY